MIILVASGSSGRSNPIVRRLRSFAVDPSTVDGALLPGVSLIFIRVKTKAWRTSGNIGTALPTKDRGRAELVSALPQDLHGICGPVPPPPDAHVIDIGGCDSHLVDALLEKEFQSVWVRDISAQAIERAKERLGPKAKHVHWVVSDVTEFVPPVAFQLWHDRAAFHFLTSEEAIYKYIPVAEYAIAKNGFLVPGTFSEAGPQRCSGLEVKRHSEVSMSARFELSFERIRCVYEDHITPFQTKQQFLFCSFRKK